MLSMQERDIQNLLAAFEAFSPVAAGVALVEPDRADRLLLSSGPEKGTSTDFLDALPFLDGSAAALLQTAEGLWFCVVPLMVDGQPAGFLFSSCFAREAESASMPGGGPCPPFPASTGETPRLSAAMEARLIDAFTDLSASLLAHEKEEQAPFLLTSHQERLLHLALDLADTGSEREVYRLVVEAALHVEGVSAAGVYAWDPKRNLYRLLLQSGFPADLAESLQEQRSDSCVAGAICSKELLVGWKQLFPNEMTPEDSRRGGCALAPLDRERGGLLLLFDETPELPASLRDTLYYLTREADEALARIAAEQHYRLAREEQKSLKSILEHSPAMVFVWEGGEGWPVRFVTPNVRQLGYEREAFLREGRGLMDLIASDDLTRLAQKMEMLDSRDLPMVDAQFRMVGPSGECRWMDGRIWIHQQVVERASHYHGIFLDITSRRRMEQDQQYLSCAVTQVAECIVVANENRIIQFVNPAFSRLLEYPEGKAWGRSFTEMIAPEKRDATVVEMEEALSSVGVWKGKIQLVAATGKKLHVDATVSPVILPDSGRRHYVMVLRDITREMSLEQQLRQAQKVQAIGTLAGGIAHDFNNILSAVSGYTQLAMFELNKEDRLYGYMDQVIQAGRRAQDLVQQILSFSRETEREPRPTNMRVVVKEAVKLLHGTLPSTIDIRQSIAPECGPVMTDPTQIHQIVMNLCTNAYHAMLDGGVLKVGLKEVTLPEGDKQYNSAPRPGTYVCLQITDTGTGIAPEHIDRVFEPYFSTKEKQGGAGLGLATVMGIVKNHEGVIRLESTPGNGTVFEVYLPRCAPPQTQATSTIVGEHEPVTGKERVLMVDDEVAITQLGQAALTRLGYSVETFNHSEEAFERFSRNPDDIDVVITDQTMPHLTGLDLARKMLRIRPDLSIILCTGFSEVVGERDALEAGIQIYLMKPAGPYTLAKSIRRLMEKAPEKATSLARSSD